MKKLLLILLLMIFSSCEEVVTIDLEASEPKLVIEASIVWLKGTPGNIQTIKVSRTTPFYAEDPDPVENATVRVYSENEDLFQFLHSEDGNYVSNNFQPEINTRYRLEITYNGQNYSAEEILLPVVPIDFVEQTQSGGFSGEDIEIKAYYTDPVGEENYYLFKFINNDVTLEFYEDEFTNGNQIFGYFSNEDIAVNNQIDIEIQGISESYYEYLFILRSQVGSNDGGPFETMPATVKGNIINSTEPDNYPLGYFRLSEADATTYTVE